MVLQVEEPPIVIEEVEELATPKADLLKSEKSGSD